MSKSTYLKKQMEGQPLDIDLKSRRVKVAFAQMGDVDRDGDVFAKSAFDKSIKERGPAGTNEIWHLLDHTAKTTSALGKFSDVYTEGNYLIGVSEYKNSFAWREVAWPLYEKGDITQHSIGFTVNDSQQDKGFNLIKDVTVWEGSAVLWGANPNTPTLEVAKSLGIYKDEEEPEVQIERMIKALRSDKWDDEAKSLFIIELKQLQDRVTRLGSIEPAEEAIQPQTAKGVDLDANLILTYLSL